jgi:hypothetical protein
MTAMNLEMMQVRFYVVEGDMSEERQIKRYVSHTISTTCIEISVPNLVLSFFVF